MTIIKEHIYVYVYSVIHSVDHRHGLLYIYIDFWSVRNSLTFAENLVLLQRMRKELGKWLYHNWKGLLILLVLNILYIYFLYFLNNLCFILV